MLTEKGQNRLKVTQCRKPDDLACCRSDTQTIIWHQPRYWCTVPFQLSCPLSLPIFFNLGLNFFSIYFLRSFENEGKSRVCRKWYSNVSNPRSQVPKNLDKFLEYQNQKETGSQKNKPNRNFTTRYKQLIGDVNEEHQPTVAVVSTTPSKGYPVKTLKLSR